MRFHKTGDYRRSNIVLQQGMQLSSDPMFHNIAAKNYEALGAYDGRASAPAGACHDPASPLPASTCWPASMPQPAGRKRRAPHPQGSESEIESRIRADQGDAGGIAEAAARTDRPNPTRIMQRVIEYLFSQHSLRRTSPDRLGPAAHLRLRSVRRSFRNRCRRP